MNITIVNESKARIPKKFIETWMADVAKNLMKSKVLSKELSKADLTLVFLDPKPARSLNLEFRGKDYATDVLSFDSMDEESLGELVMCPEVLKKQAIEHDLTFQAELGYMLIHGILHLLGYDHETNEKDAAEMFGIQDALFEKLLTKK